MILSQFIIKICYATIINDKVLYAGILIPYRRTKHSEARSVLEKQQIAKELRQLFPLTIVKKNEPLNKYTYTKTGGAGDIVVFPNTKEDVQGIVKWVHEHKVPLTILGNSSNVIIKDGGIRGVVMILTDLNEVEIKKNKLIVQSGASIIETAQKALSANLTGLEFACGIPGSVGGAVFMNAGAYGGEVKTVIKSVEVVTLEGKRHVYSNEEMAFGYRTSVIQERGDIVLETIFELEKGKFEHIKEKMDELTELRESKQPLEYPSCGSVFKRPTGYFTGKLIQDAGLQGKIWGGAQISTKHAGFIVNINNATATDYLELIAYIQKTIKEVYDVTLETEVRVIGENLVENIAAVPS